MYFHFITNVTNSIQSCFLVLYVRYVMKPSPMMNKVGSGPMQLTGPLSNQAPPYVRCYTPPSNNTNTVGQAIASPTDYQIILKLVLLSIKHYPTKPRVACYTPPPSNNTNTIGQTIASSASNKEPTESN